MLNFITTIPPSVCCTQALRWQVGQRKKAALNGVKKARNSGIASEGRWGKVRHNIAITTWICWLQNHKKNQVLQFQSKLWWSSFQALNWWQAQPWILSISLAGSIPKHFCLYACQPVWLQGICFSWVDSISHVKLQELFCEKGKKAHREKHSLSSVRCLGLEFSLNPDVLVWSMH